MVIRATMRAPEASPAFSTTVLVMTFWSLVGGDVININEDGDTHWLQAKSQKPLAEIGLRLTDGPNGLPVPIDKLLIPFLTSPSDDQGQGGDAECLNGSELSELDMCLTPRQTGLFDSISVQGRRRRRQASANGFSLWKHGVIPYVFNTTFPPHDHEAILGAMAEWEKSTCIRFRLATAQDTDIVVFRDGRRCSTNIGRIGREQAVTLAKSCRSKRILIHELGHVIGLIHEHQRHDRDKYVKVLLENVRNMSQERYQFSKLLSGSITDKTVKYDYTSVMHYGRNYFARSPELTTLQTTDGLYQDIIGRAERPSFSDVETVNRLYQCAAGCYQSVQCSESCYMDRTCVCRCSSGLEKTFLNVPYHNSLHDSTCDFFASRGECTGNIKDTLRPLCAKSCGLHLLKLHNPLPEVWAQALRPTSNHLQPKSVDSSWGTSASAQSGVTSLGLNNDITAVNDVDVAGDTVIPAVPRSAQASSTHPSLQQEPTFLPNSHQNRQVTITTSIEAHRGNQQQQGQPPQQQDRQLQVTNSHGVTQLQGAILQKPSVPGTADSHTFRSLLLSRTPIDTGEQISLIGQVAIKTRQGNGYHLGQRTTRVPGKFSSQVVESLVGSVGDVQGRSSQRSEASNWFSRFSSHQMQQQEKTSLRGALLLQALRTQTDTLMQGFNGAANHMTANVQVEHGLSNGEGGFQFINEHGKIIGGRVNVENAFSRRGGADTAQRNREVNNQGANNPQAAGVERGGGSPPLAEYAGPEFGPLGSALNGMAHTETINGPDTSRNLQTIGPSFMKSETAPQNFLTSEQSSPLGSPVELISKDTLEPAIAEQHFPANVRSQPQQTFEPSFFLAAPSSRPQQSHVSVWESPIIRLGGVQQPSNGNTELVIDTPSPSGQPGAPIDQPPVAGRSGPLHHSQQTTSEGGGSHHQPGYPGVDAPHINHQLWYQIHQQLQNNEMQSQQVPLFHVLSRHLSFTDPNAGLSDAMAIRESDNVFLSTPPNYSQLDHLASIILTSLTSNSEPRAEMAKRDSLTTATPSLLIGSHVEHAKPHAATNMPWNSNSNISRDIFTFFPDISFKNNDERNASSRPAGVVYSFPSFSRQKRWADKGESSH